MKRTRVMLPIMFKEFKVVYIFLLFFCLTIIVNWWIVNFSKILGGRETGAPPSLPGFYESVLYPFLFVTLTLNILLQSFAWIDQDD